MLPVSALAGFCLAVTPLVVTPGASFTLVSARAITGDRRGAWAVITGTALGIATHAILAGLGLAAVVLQSAEVYRVVRLAGAAYLIGLGLLMLRRSRQAAPAVDATGDPEAAASLTRKGWHAYVANVLNVKAASVYLTLGPQFIPAQRVGVVSMLLLACTHVLVMASWLGLWSAGLTRATRRLDVRRCRRAIDRAGGAVLVALGARTAAQPR